MSFQKIAMQNTLVALKYIQTIKKKTVMDFAQKKIWFEKLLGAEFLEADLKLLREKKPESQALQTGLIDKKQAQSDVLWDLLEVATGEEIKTNRGEKNEVKTVQKTKETTPKPQPVNKKTEEPEKEQQKKTAKSSRKKRNIRK